MLLPLPQMVKQCQAMLLVLYAMLKGRVGQALSPSSSRSESLSPSPAVQPPKHEPPRQIKQSRPDGKMVKPEPMKPESPINDTPRLKPTTPTSPKMLTQSADRKPNGRSASQLRKERLKQEQERLQQMQINKKMEFEEEQRRKQMIREQQEALERKRIQEEEKKLQEEQRKIQEEIKKIEEDEKKRESEERERKLKEEEELKKQIGVRKAKREQEAKIKREQEYRQRKLEEQNV